MSGIRNDFLKELESVPAVKKKYLELQEDAAAMAEKCVALHEKVEELERQIRHEPTVSEVEEHLNDILDYMDGTAEAAGLHIDNIYIITGYRNGRFQVSLRGEVTGTAGTSVLEKNACIKASVYDSRGHIEIEGKQYIFKNNFCGYDTFEIGWNGGDEYSWLRQKKIRLFVTLSY